MDISPAAITDELPDPVDAGNDVYGVEAEAEVCSLAALYKIVDGHFPDLEEPVRGARQVVLYDVETGKRTVTLRQEPAGRYSMHLRGIGSFSLFDENHRLGVGFDIQNTAATSNGRAGGLMQSGVERDQCVGGITDIIKSSTPNKPLGKLPRLIGQITRRSASVQPTLSD